MHDSTTPFVSPSIHLSVSWSVCWSVGQSLPILLFLMILFLWAKNGLVASNMAPAHLHMTFVAMYLALFYYKSCLEYFSNQSC